MESFKGKTASESESHGLSFFSSSLCRIAVDASLRSYAIFHNIQSTLFSAIILLPKTFGAPAPAPEPGYPLLDPPESSYLAFDATPSNETTVIADSKYFSDRSLQFAWWRNRAAEIRRSGDFALCTGNLSLALADVGAAYQTSSNGSTTLLTLLPTAGALIGAPAKELWVLYKLVPLAGFLSMALSLGGNIVPHQVSDYTSLEDFSYSGMRSTAVGEKSKRHTGSTPNINSLTEETDSDVSTAAQKFAEQVYERAMDPRGSNKTPNITAGIVVLCSCVVCILVACWFLQTGAIVVWWCTVSNLMYLSTIVAHR